MLNKTNQDYDPKDPIRVSITTTLEDKMLANANYRTN